MGNRLLKNNFFTSILHVVIPIFIGFIIHLLIKSSFPLTTTLIYGIMVLFMIPSDVFFGSNMDYQIKSVNPTYKQTSPDYVGKTKWQIINISIVALALVISLFFSL